GGDAGQAVGDGGDGKAADLVGQLDVVVVKLHVQPVGGIPDGAEAPLLGLFRLQARVGNRVGGDLGVAARIASQRFAGWAVAGGCRAEGRLLGQDIQGRGTEAFTVVGAQLQALDRLPAQRDHRGEVVAVVTVALVAAGDIQFHGVDNRKHDFEIGGV